MCFSLLQSQVCFLLLKREVLNIDFSESDCAKSPNNSEEPKFSISSSDFISLSNFLVVLTNQHHRILLVWQSDLDFSNPN